ncbi:MAG TPA: DUF308 domain-containing protein [Myxococcaceae bacterium]|jgi:uncharacterized membrane protein HdeD (DUF308 family)
MATIAIERVNTIHLAERWGTLVARGAVAMLFGVLTFLAPWMSLLTLVFLWGAFALVDGVLNLTMASRRARAGSKRWGWLLFEGAVAVLAAVGAFVWPGITALILLGFVAARSLLSGAAQVGAAIRLRKEIQHEWLLALAGVLSIAFGVVLVMFPGLGLLTIVLMVGAYSFIFGALLIGVGLRLRQWRSETAERTVPSGAVPTHP